MRFKKLSVIVLVLLFSSNYAFADYTGGADVQRIYVQDNWCYIQAIEDIANTCSYFYYRFKFNITTHQGKAMLSVLLMAKALNKKIDVWYNPSAAPGTNETNGCNTETVAEATGIAIQ